MKKLILKTALITFGVTLILAVSVFGILSFFVPAAMMKFFGSMGFETISGDYAYQQYQISKDIDYLARAFEIAASHESDSVAAERFDEFYGEDGSEQRVAFNQYCEKQNELTFSESIPDSIRAYDYRAFIIGQAAVIKYRLATTLEEKESVCAFALGETGVEFTEECPAMALTAAMLDKEDGEFAALLLKAIRAEEKFNTENAYYLRIVKILEDASK